MIAGELQKKVARSILYSDIKTLDSRHSGKYISNIMFDAGQVQHLVSVGVLNLMKDSFSVIASSITEFFNLKNIFYGDSFLEEIIKK